MKVTRRHLPFVSHRVRLPSLQVAPTALARRHGGCSSRLSDGIELGLLSLMSISPPDTAAVSMRKDGCASALFSAASSPGTTVRKSWPVEIEDDEIRK